MLQLSMNFEHSIRNYIALESTIELVQHTKIVLLVGISGAGKDTLKKELLKTNEYYDIVSHTTRQPRSNNGQQEIADVDYHFIDMKQAEELVASQAFIEVKLVHGTVYGTSADELREAHQQHKIAITDLDVQGVDEYKDLSRDVVAIFILPPSYGVWRERLQKRYASEEEFLIEWPKRRQSAIEELTKALEVPYYHFIINDDLHETVRVANEIAHKPDIFLRQDDEARLAARDLLDNITAQN